MVGKVTAKRVDPSKILFGVLIDVYFNSPAKIKLIDQIHDWYLH